MFPEELPRRLIKMYSFVGETVLDPFLGSGTTVKVALELKRNAIGYEINENFLEIIKKKIGLQESLFDTYNVEVVERLENIKPKDVDYEPNIQDAKPLIDPKKIDFRKNALHKVVEIVDENTIKLDSNLLVKFLGVEIIKKKETIEYLRNYILNRDVMLKFENGSYTNSDVVYAYVYLKNKIFVNAYLIKSGLAKADKSRDYRMKGKFIKLEVRDRK